ncbi:ATP-binding protein [bacterium]|nr:ATP-binding protein [bacterium]
MRGARQVGKSFSVRNFAESQNLQLFEINLDRHLHLEAVFATKNVGKILAEISGTLGVEISSQKSLLFLDEIQATPSAIAALRYFYEELPAQAVVAAGSLLEFTLSDHEFSMPVGRVRYGHMYPMNFEEFLEAFDESLALNRLRSFRLGEEFSANLHERISGHLRNYFFTGGLPEVVAQFVKTRSLRAAQQVLEEVVSSYQDDFSKYAKHSQLLLLQTVLKSVPADIGCKIKYAHLSPHHKSVDVKKAIELLSNARLVLPVWGSSCSGIPLGAQVNRQIFKLYCLDIGFLNRLLNLSSHSDRFREPQLIHEGPQAEQFIAQHLADLSGGTRAPELFYWLRENPRSNAEVDFVVQHDEQVVPLEVKAGKSGSLKSLMQFVSEKGSKVGVRFYGGLPQRQEVAHSVATPDGVKVVKYNLLSLPLYFVGQLPRILEQPLR